MSPARGRVGAKKLLRLGILSPTEGSAGASTQAADPRPTAWASTSFKLSTGEQFWISGPRRDGADRLYRGAVPIEIDDDVRVEYWTDIRGLPHRIGDMFT